MPPSVNPDAALIAAFDGMGGHADGARAAELARQVLLQRFAPCRIRCIDPLAFLHIALGAAHNEMVALGLHLPLEQRPRATGAVCLVQDGTAWWAHVGDSRIYHLRDGEVISRTRDHSHVELLVQEGLISADQAQNHPMRNYVESCLGGDPMLPEMLIGRGVQRAAPATSCWSAPMASGPTCCDEDIAASLYSGMPLQDARLTPSRISPCARAGARQRQYLRCCVEDHVSTAAPPRWSRDRCAARR